MFLSEIWKQWQLTYLLNNGHYNWWYFPFQLCSIPMYICLLFPWVSSFRLRSILLTFLMDFGLLGGIFAFCDTSGMHYGYLPLTVHSFGWHILLIVIGIYAGLINKNTCSNRDYFHSAKIYLGCCLTATILNLALHPYGSINMFYISPYYVMSQKVFCEIAGTLGNAFGIVFYLCATLLGAYLLHQIWKRIPFGL